MDDIKEQIKQLRASRPIDQRSDTGWDDLSSVRFQIAHTMEKMLARNEKLENVLALSIVNKDRAEDQERLCRVEIDRLNALIVDAKARFDDIAAVKP